ncbi:MAG: hypothetical protein E2591_04000 [Achromobacter sp.]|uniref:hypothetical protein n=1 Tax=Achromobacter sp. TaxID=134375 RepID=UPI0012CC1C20|nr:hypothetical protein [Achromobacter sp.]
MSTDQLYCSWVDVYVVDPCMTMGEWTSFWTVVIGFLGAAKLLWEIRQFRRNRQREQTLKRTEFFLQQHRRLYDDADLAGVIKHLDGDDAELADESSWERNRKFLTFIEEIEILLMSGNLDAAISYHMFGYFACKARDGKNFNAGIDASEENWRLFYKFCANCEEFNRKYPEGLDDWKFARPGGIGSKMLLQTLK